MTRASRWTAPWARCRGIASPLETHAIRPAKAHVPSRLRTAGSSRRAPIMTMNTVTAEASAMP